MSFNIKRSVLVIEDNALNREILCEILADSYEVYAAGNGLEGLKILQESDHPISLVLLDIEMPVMNGYEFLEAVRQIPSLASIPIIVTTTYAGLTDEIACLDKGASDFVSKPYNIDLVLKRVKSMIRLSEANSLLSKVEFDELTGVYGKESFYIRAEQILKNAPDGTYDMLCCDIDSFKMINDRYGTKRGDELLIYMARMLTECYGHNTLVGRISGDIFAVLVKNQPIKNHRKLAGIFAASMKRAEVPNVTVHLGLSQHIEHDALAQLVCNDCMVAIDTIRHRYDVTLAEFNQEIKEQLQKEKMIVESMDKGLRAHQFEVYYQPKIHLQKIEPGGAEALIRWNHPEFGFLTPGQFVPLFEKNGLIHRIDSYVCQQVAQDIKEWQEEGLPVVPISMNMSRTDFDKPTLIDDILHMVRSFDIDSSLIHVEVTESAYAQSPEIIEEAVNSLRASGIQVELDDFGSGYSSLNILINLEMDVLKLDMSLVRNMESDKQKLLLEHIFSIADTLGMEVVAEGVESQKQAIELTKMGCTYAQGYYFSKPLSKENFEQYLLEAKGAAAG